MPLRLEIKKLLASRSERVKSCDIHPDEPWVLSALYTGHLFIWNFNTQTVVKSFEVSDQPIRCAKFITRKQWVICGSDDMLIRVFNYNTLEKVKEFEGHIDYIRYIDVHKTQPYVLTSSDDMTIKLWDWEKNWANTQIFEGHGHYVMQVKFNPKDSSTFASASLDKSVKVWSIGSPLPNFSLEGHDRGVNCLDYYLGGDKPYLVSGADDKSIKIWDYQTKSCVQTLDGHTSNVSAVVFHPKLPIIISGSEDGTVRLWNSNTYRLETTLNYGLERCWALAVSPSSNKVAVGYDEGTIVISLGHEMPVVSMDNAGKVLMANNNDIYSTSVRGAGSSGVGDGERVEYQTKELGSCEIFPQKMTHNSNGRFVAVSGDGEYIIYTAQALRNKSFGSALDFVWSSDGTGDYAVRESSSRIRIFKNFKETQVFKPPFSADGLFGGNLVGITGNEFVVFYDWTECRLVMRIDVAPLSIYWSQDGQHVVLACEESYFVLKCDLDAINDAFANGTASPEEGVEGSFELLHEIGEKVESGQWVGSCFIYSNSVSRLNYYVGGEVMTLTHLDREMYLMGFVAKENRVFLIDKNRSVSSYTLLESVLQYQTAVVQGDFELANQLLPVIPREKYNDVARFLEAQGHKEVALQVADDPDQRFELALQLENLEVALEIMRQEIVPSSTADENETETRWKQLGDLALASGKLKLAQECAVNASDFSGLLLMYTSSGDESGMLQLADLAQSKGKSNIAFVCSLLLGDSNRCIQILHEAKRFGEAAFFARTYAPSKVAECVNIWKEDLKQTNPKAAQALANPAEYPDLFPEFDIAMQVEQIVQSARGGKSCSSTQYPIAYPNSEAVLVDLMEAQGPDAIASLFSFYSGSAAPRAPAAAPAPPAVDMEAERRQQQQQEEMARQQAEAEELAKQQEAELLAKQQAEEEALARQQEAELLAKQEAEEEEKRRREELARQQREEAEKLKQQQLLQQQEAERIRQQQELEAQKAAQAAASLDEEIDKEIEEAVAGDGVDDDEVYEDMEDLEEDMEEFEDWS